MVRPFRSTSHVSDGGHPRDSSHLLRNHLAQHDQFPDVFGVRASQGNDTNGLG